MYEDTLNSFENGISPEPVSVVQLLSNGKSALQELNDRRGLGFDSWDLDFYHKMFTETLKRNPTDVECFDLGQSNSEHSRHWFFGGKMVIDGEAKSDSLFSMVKATLPKESNSVIAFHDNSSAIYGFEASVLGPVSPAAASPMALTPCLLHPILTAETHNFPCGVAPFPGAETGTGGRLRDVQATGRGALTQAGISAYCVGNLRVPGYPLPWEAAGERYPAALASPLDIAIEASSGASDYGNKFGEPVVCGFARSFGQRTAEGSRREWLKPVMFTAGVGWLRDDHKEKLPPQQGMVVCKVGGPAYRIGMGGGAASSRVTVGDAAAAALDFNAVQRGDAEMENRMNRLVRACVELGAHNPIVSIHDQGAGGNGNVLKEIVHPLGADYDIRSVPLGDPSMSVLEIWGAEYQESNALLVRPEDLATLQAIGRRENCPVAAVGVVTNTGNVVVRDSLEPATSQPPFDMPLELVLGKMPQKVFTDSSKVRLLLPLQLPEGESVRSALERVLRLMDVGSKRFLTNKVDRSVTGLVAQQQCVGPLHTPLSNVAVLAQSHFSLTGLAVAVGEQPIKGLVSSAAQARMTVGEALTNLMWARITKLSDVKASCNWMWAAKLEGEAANMWEACSALKDALLLLGVSIDGGKDSLSMAARAPLQGAAAGEEIVKCPGQMTFTCYAPCPDITKTVTPDLKYPGSGQLFLVSLGGGRHRLGGSALATVYSQLGDRCPDLDAAEDVLLLRRCFETVQRLLDLRLLESGHDISDGGLVVTLLEMAFAGSCGISVQLPADPLHSALERLFSEELGVVMEVLPHNAEAVVELFRASGLCCSAIGSVRDEGDYGVEIRLGDQVALSASMFELRDVWESTSFELERLQCDVGCVEQEQQDMRTRTGAATNRTTFEVLPLPSQPSQARPRMAVIRQEGSNGDREMLAAFHAAGFETWDVNMNDLLRPDCELSLESLRGVAFCGGFSYADVMDSAKGWAGVIRFNERLLRQFDAFRRRTDTFSLGVCNGCQLMALLGWVPLGEEQGEQQPRFIHNASKRFESRWSTVKIAPSPAVMLRGMEGSTLGVWVAHGEGRVHFPNPDHLNTVLSKGLAPLRFVDDDNNPTTRYPLNPNGSVAGIAALCSEDGRHLAVMPHPERCFLSWQWPHMPASWQARHRALLADASLPLLAQVAAPWMRMFQNAFSFCEESR